MQVISAEWRAAMNTGWQIANAVHVLSAGAPVDPGGIVRVVDGSVTVSRTGSTRRSLSLTLAVDEVGQGLIPDSSSGGLLTPFGNEIAPQLGWVNPSTGVPELVSTGVFAIETVTANDTGTQLGLTVTGYDRSWTMSLRKFLAPYAITDGTPGDAALADLVTSTLGTGVPQNITPAFDDAGDPLTVSATTFNENTDPWAAAQTIADAIGYEIFFDPVGTFTALPIPDPTTAPVAWSYAEGNANLLASISRSLTRNGVSNDFIVTGSGTGVAVPVRGQASVTDPNDPMFIGGGFGDVPTFTNSSVVTSDSQAAFAAQNQLAAAQGQVESVSLIAALNPALDVDDVVYVYRPRIGMDGFYVLDTVQFGFTPAAITVMTGRRAR